MNYLLDRTITLIFQGKFVSLQWPVVWLYDKQNYQRCGDRMTVMLRMFVLMLSVVSIVVPQCYATSHAFVMSSDGEVWIVSDTLSVNDEYSYYLHSWIEKKSTVCKVTIQRGRIIFNAGSFMNASLLLQQEAALPFGDFMATAHAIDPLLSQHRSLYPGASSSPTYSDKRAGVIQVQDGVYAAVLTNLLNDGEVIDERISSIMSGVPHGFGTYVMKMTDNAFNSAALRKQIAEHPEDQLLKILELEASAPNSDVGPPFTIFLLHKDGTVSDYSQKHVCEIPTDAIYRVRPPVHNSK